MRIRKYLLGNTHSRLVWDLRRNLETCLQHVYLPRPGSEGGNQLRKFARAGFESGAESWFELRCAFKYIWPRI